MAVVVQPGLVVMILPLEAERVADAGFACDVGDDFARFAPGFVVHFQRERAMLIGQRLRGAQVVGVVVVHRLRRLWLRSGLTQRVLVRVVGIVLAPGRHLDAADGVGVHLRQRHEAVRLEQVVHRFPVAGFEGQHVAVPAV
ncbi:hypothetical protein Cv017_12145 [Chromobacterium subtsugae]|nr:hypothetical protein Cv017_12145 [Chromobacterium subtsugae]